MSSKPAGTRQGAPDMQDARSLRSARFPPRPRAVLEAILARCGALLEEGLINALNDFDQQLFRLTEQARSNEAQQRCFEALRELRRGRADVTPRYLIAFETRLSRLEDDTARKARTSAPVASVDMSLVDEVEFEQTLALQEIASKAEIRHSQALFMLGRRFAVLAGTRAFEPEDLPVGPLALTECLREAQACLDLASEFRVQLYRSFDRHVMSLLQRLYEQINAICVEQRILPNLTPVAPRTASKTPNPPAQRPAASPRAATPAAPAPVPAAPAPPATPPSPAGAYGWGTPAPMLSRPDGQPLPGATRAARASPGTSVGRGAGPGASQDVGSTRFGDPPAAGGAAPAEVGAGVGGLPTTGSDAPAGVGADYGSGAFPGIGYGDRTGARRGARSNAAGAAYRGDDLAPAGGAGGASARAAPGEPTSDSGLSSIPGAAGFANPMTGWPVIQPAGTFSAELSRAAANVQAVGTSSASVGGAFADAETASEPTSFEAIRRLLAGRRAALGQAGRPPADATHPVSTADLQEVLAALQLRPAPSLHVGDKFMGRSVAHLKQDLLAQLRQLSPPNKTPTLDEADNDTIDLVGMLFDHLARELRPARSVQDLIGRLQVPLLRVALNDKSFFTRRNHPARQLLNAIAEAGLFWFDDTGEDRQLVDKMRLVVDRISSEFDGNLGLFEEMLIDFARHLQTITRKSEVAERRHIEAAKGREKLELAREHARRAIDALLARHRPPALIRTLLEQAWTDVLALTVLRHGEDSAAYRERLEVADRLIALAETGGGTDSAADRALKLEVETGLAQVGYHVEDIRSVVKRLFNLVDEATGEEAPSATDVAIKLRARSRLGGQADAETANPAATAEKMAPLNSAEQRVLERLRTIPFGTWFDFVINQQGAKARRKLSWFSPLTGRCLFVNQRGARVDERSLEQLARLIVKGQVSVVEAQRESLIDRTWSAIVSSLKQFGGARPVLAGSEA